MELNEAILNVITTMRKKDMKAGAFETVKKAGYTGNTKNIKIDNEIYILYLEGGL